MNDIKCDRCGEYCGGGCFTDHQIIKNKGICVGDNVAVYLCGDCQQQLEQWLNFHKTTERPTPPTTGSNIQAVPAMTHDDRLVNIVEKFADDLADKRRIIADLTTSAKALADVLASVQLEFDEMVGDYRELEARLDDARAKWKDEQHKNRVLQQEKEELSHRVEDLLKRYEGGSN